MNLMPKWVLPPTMPSIHDTESFTALEMVARVYGAMNTLINEYNAYVEALNARQDGFEKETNAFMDEMEDFMKTNLNKTAWGLIMEGIEDGSIPYPTDPSLSRSEIPAEAKATGAAIAAKAGELAQLIAVERARLDNLAKLPEGSNAETAQLADVKIGAAGESYTNPGNAVRGQIGSLIDTTAWAEITNVDSRFAVVVGSVDAAGKLLPENSDYKTEYMTVDRSCEVYFEPYEGKFLQIAVFDGAFGENYIARYRYNVHSSGTENTLCYEDNPLHIEAGQTIAVTFEADSFSYHMKGSNGVFGVKLNPHVELDPNQKKEVVDLKKTVLEENSFVSIKKEDTRFVPVIGSVDAAGKLLPENSDYKTEYLTVDRSCQVYFEPYNGEFVQIAIFDGAFEENFIARYRKNFQYGNTEDTLCYKDNPVNVNAGQTIAITYLITDKVDYDLRGSNGVFGAMLNQYVELHEKQKADIESLFVDNAAFSAITNGDSKLTKVPGYISVDGVLTDDGKGHYYTEYLTVDRSCQVYFEPYTGWYVQLAIMDGGIGGYLAAPRYRYSTSPSGSEDTLCYKDNPANVEAGQTLAISYAPGANFFLCGNNSAFSVKLNKNIELHNGDSTQSGKKAYIQYDNAAGANYRKESVFVYLPTVTGYVGYEFAHVVGDEINADNWRIIEAFAATDSLSKRFPLTSPGEWEMAIKIQGREDYMGGSLHGDEVVNSVAFLVDGVRKTPAQLAELTEFETLRIIEDTKMYDPMDNVTHVANHGKEYVFTKEGLTLRQSVNWKTERELTESFLTMLPIFRGNDEYSAIRITDSLITDDDFIIYDVATAVNDKAYEHKKGVKSATLFSDDSGVCASVKINRYPETTGGNWFHLSDAANYNKMYFTCAGYGDTHKTKVGEKWNTETEYKISIK